MITGAISIAFIVSIALYFSGVGWFASVAISVSIAILYLVYRALTEVM